MSRVKRPSRPEGETRGWAPVTRTGQGPPPPCSTLRSARSREVTEPTPTNQPVCPAGCRGPLHRPPPSWLTAWTVAHSLDRPRGCDSSPGVSVAHEEGRGTSCH